MKKGGIVLDSHNQQPPRTDHAKWFGDRQNETFSPKDVCVGGGEFVPLSQC